MFCPGRLRPRLLASVALIAAVLGRSVPALADDRFDIPSPSNYGGAGLLDTRTARFFPDGYLDITASLTQPDTRYSITVEALPWLELSFRYAINKAIAENPVLHDRSFDAKFRLFRETADLPQIAFGFQDLIGTGVYSAEYLVASKRWGPLDFSFGMGWGRLGTHGTFKNPFGLLRKSFLVRGSESSNLGGAFALNAYFHGPEVGLFGGVEYETPIDKLKIKIEYSSDAYSEELKEHGTNYGFPVNAGVSYRPLDWLDIGVSWMHGRYLGLRFSAVTDLKAETWGARIDPAPRFRPRPQQAAETILQHTAPADRQQQTPAETRFIDLTAQTVPQQLPDLPALPGIAIPTLPAAPPVLQNVAPPAVDATARIRAGIEAQKLVLDGLDIEGQKLTILIENPRYLRDTEAVARTARVLSAAAPVDVNEFEITLLAAGQPVSTVRLQRREIDALARRQGSPAELFQTAELLPGQFAPLDHLSPDLFPQLNTYVYPVVQESLFDPDNPFYYRVAAGAGADLRLTRGWSVDGDIVGTIFSNFNQIRRGSNSVLPHVRSDVTEYLRKGAYGIEDLTTSYLFKLAPEVYARVTGGYLEQMFAGIGGEVLYRPYGSRWAVGLDLWTVRQRGFDDLLDLRHYQALTGHITAYYQLPWHDVSVGVSGGQYLAGDKGVTFQFFRSFSTGVRIGAWFTVTNVSARQFGEGSFDKGIYIFIPLEWVAPFSSRSSYTLAMRPIQRDGGQRLSGDMVLYDVTSGSDYGAYTSEWNSIFR